MGSDAVKTAGSPSAEASATAFGLAYPAPGGRAGDRSAAGAPAALGTSTTAVPSPASEPGRPTLPANLPRSGPGAPAVDLAALADQPFLLAWVDDAGLWLYEEGAAAPRQLAAGQGFRRPQLDPARRAVAWQAVDPAHSDDPELWSLWAMRLDGAVEGAGEAGAAREAGPARQILTPADLPEARGWNGLPCPRWLRDLQWMGGEPARLALATSAVGECGEAPQRDLWVFDLAETAPRRLLEDGVAHFRPSPDGRRFAIVAAGDYWANPPRAGRINVYEPGQGEPQALLAFAAYATESEAWQYPDLLWVDAGRALLVVIEPALLEDRFDGDRPSLALRLGLDGARSQLAVLPSTAMDTVSRGLDRYHGLGTQVRRPRWSADLSTLAVLDWRSVEDGATLALVSTMGGAPRPYDALDTPVFHGWAPTASRFLYGDPHSLFLGAEGQAPRRLFETSGSGERIELARWAGDDHYVLLRAGLSIPPLLEIHGLDGSSRGLAQSVGIELDALP